MNDFTSDLQWSHEQSVEPWWEEVYRQAFPGFTGMHLLNSDGWAQRGGIDRQVFLSDGTVLKIDEKSRRQAWPDFLLEYWSDEQRRIPGWIAKPLTCDYIAYAFVPTRTCYLLPFQLLRLAWQKHRRCWVQEYGAKRAQNARYTTVSVAVPIDVVLQSLSESMVVHWSAASVNGVHA